MSRLATIAALIVALAVPASATAKHMHASHKRVTALCPQNVVLLPGRPYGMCGGRFWIRDPETGKVVPVSFWRLQRLNDPPDDRP
jgi:hypothetical protein